MTKGLIFIGGSESGKSRAARQISKFYGNQAVYLDGYRFRFDSPFYFQICTQQTKVLIIDEIISTKYLEYFMQFIPGKLRVNKLNEESFEIELEKLIIVCSSEIKKDDLPIGASFMRRFDVIEFPNAEIVNQFITYDVALIDDMNAPFDFDKLFYSLNLDS